jgi:hypothetical protein
MYLMDNTNDNHDNHAQYSTVAAAFVYLTENTATMVTMPKEHPTKQGTKLMLIYKRW